MQSIREYTMATTALILALVAMALVCVFAGFWDGHVGRGLGVGSLCLIVAGVEYWYAKRYLKAVRDRGWVLGRDGWVQFVSVDGDSVSARSGDSK